MPSSTCVFLCVVLFMSALVAGFILLAISTTPSRSYNVAVDAVSGLDLSPSKAPVLDPQFNLTLRFASTNPLRRECMDGDTYVQVFYRCTQLAAGAAVKDRLCVGPKNSTEVHFVAKGTGVRLPGILMDSLTADMRNGVEAFDVTLRPSGVWWVLWCGARQVGDGGAWCGDYWNMCGHRDRTTSDPAIFTPPIFIPPEE